MVVAKLQYLVEFKKSKINSMGKKKTEIESYIIGKVKEKRIIKGFTQAELAFKLGVSSGFIGKVESVHSTSKYNLNHLNNLAKIFQCSIKNFLPDDPI